MGRPADSSSINDQSLTVLDNRTGKTYTIPYVPRGDFREG
jgi:hypothetical protein